MGFEPILRDGRYEQDTGSYYTCIAELMKLIRNVHRVVPKGLLPQGNILISQSLALSTQAICAGENNFTAPLYLRSWTWRMREV